MGQTMVGGYTYNIVPGGSLNVSSNINGTSSETIIKSQTATEWYTFDPVLDDGDVGIDTTNKVMKIGDGVKKWSEIDYGFPAVKIDNDKLETKGKMKDKLIDKFKGG